MTRPGPLVRTAAFFSFLLLLAFSAGAAEPAKVSRPVSQFGAILANEFVAAAMEPNGQFTMGTVEGDPTRTSDNNKKLIFGHPSPGTSDTFLRVDGVTIDLSTAAQISGPTRSGNSLSTTFLVAGVIEVVETLTIVQSLGTSTNPDTFRISFRVRNTDTVAHDVSLRTQLDTQLADNDGAPFRILENNVGAVTSDIEFDNDAGTGAIGDIPGQAIVFDSLSNPTVISLFTFLDGISRVPDRVVFGKWGSAVNQYDYTVTPTAFSDSSVIVYWGYPDPNAVNLAPGDSEEFVMYYGLGGLRFYPGPPLNIGIFARSHMTVTTTGTPTYNYLPDPLPVTVFVENATAGPVAGAQASIVLPSELTLTTGDTVTKDIEDTLGSGVLNASATAQLTWGLDTFGRHIGTRRYTFQVRYPGGSFRLPDPFLVIVPGLPGAVYGQATDNAGAAIAGATLRLFLNGTLMGTTVSQADGTYIFENLSPGRYQVRLSVAGQPDITFDAVVSNDPSENTSVNPIPFAAPAAENRPFTFPNPVREGNAHISFYADGPADGEVRIYSQANELIETFPATASGAGWREVSWNIKDVANGVYLYEVELAGKIKKGRLAVVKWRGR